MCSCSLRRPFFAHPFLRTLVADDAHVAHGTVQFILTFKPLCGTMRPAAPPSSMKPSELVPAFSKLLAELCRSTLILLRIASRLGVYRRLRGFLNFNVDHTGAHIFYTGNARVAPIISAAAAKDLTLMTSAWAGRAPL